MALLFGIRVYFALPYRQIMSVCFLLLCSPSQLNA